MHTSAWWNYGTPRQWCRTGKVLHRRRNLSESQREDHLGMCRQRGRRQCNRAKGAPRPRPTGGHHPLAGRSTETTKNSGT
ncbi:MAG: hypothetical protein OXF06_13750 [Bacteroidetes bacterium]|nr:hypothetical protein [Bacteroidota bacterium]